MVIELSRSVGKCIFKSSWEKFVWKNGKQTDERELDKFGVPVWNVKAELQQEGEDTDEIIVKVPMERNPAEGLQYNEEIVFVDVVIVSGKRSTGGRWETISAKRIVRRKREQGKEKKDGDGKC